MSGYKNSKNTSIFTYLCYLVLAIIVFLVILTVFNMDLFMSYFGNVGNSTSFGAFFARLGDYIVAVLRHTFNF